MLTSFFSKSRPVNIVIITLYLLVFFLIFSVFKTALPEWILLLKKGGIFLVLIFSIFLLNFISGKNELTGKNGFKIVLFAGFVCAFPAVFNNYNIILANLFLLLAMRRMISLKSQRHTAQKIFDATFWIGIASLFYFWSVFFLFLVYFAVLVHAGHKFKNWLIPFVAVLVLLSLVTSGSLLVNDTFYTWNDWFQASNFDFINYRSLPILLPVAFMFALTIWASFFYILIIQKASANTKTSLFIILLAAGLAITVAVFAPDKNSSELLFFFAPLAIIVSNYFEKTKDKWFKESLLFVIVLLPVLLLIFS